MLLLHIIYLCFTAKLHLTGHSVHNLRYLSGGSTDYNDMEDKSRFDAWKVNIITIFIILCLILSHHSA